MSSKLPSFLESIAAAYDLLKRAQEKQAYIEFVVLIASVIDGMLRMGLVLKHQLNTDSMEIPEELVFQADSAKPISERAIYDRALSAGVIDTKLHDTLHTLYDQRNRVVHRYVISEISTVQVFAIAVAYDQLLPSLTAMLDDLEVLQLKLGRGMTRVVSDPEWKGSARKDLQGHIAKKHGHPVMARLMASEPPIDNNS